MSSLSEQVPGIHTQGSAWPRQSSQSNYILTMRLAKGGCGGVTDTTRTALLEVNLIEILEFLFMVILPEDAYHHRVSWFPC